MGIGWAALDVRVAPRVLPGRAETALPDNLFSFVDDLGRGGTLCGSTPMMIRAIRFPSLDPTGVVSEEGTATSSWAYP
ncbi:MAG TPA: hypothetical protein VJ777_07675 [Mycobacterium sp.]|nr:hypothetical protein [Mycobacterium sp.]